MSGLSYRTWRVAKMLQTQVLPSATAKWSSDSIQQAASLYWNTGGSSRLHLFSPR